MSALAYLVAASSERGDLSALAAASPSSAPSSDQEDEEPKTGRRRVVYGEDLDPESCYPPSPGPLDCAFSDALYSVLSERLPRWGAWLPSLPRLPYWVTSLPSSGGFTFGESRGSSGYLAYWRTPLPSPSRQGAQPDVQDGTMSPPASNAAEEARGVVAYLLVASGEDVRPEGMAMGLLGEIYQSLRLALPMVASNLLQFMVGIVSFAFVGHLGIRELAATVLAVGMTRVTGHVVLMGLGGALEMLYGQAKVVEEYGIQMVYLQRALFVLTLACLPIAAVWCWAEPLLVAMGQQPEIAHMAAQYVIWLLPSLLANAWIQAIIRYLQVQGITLAMDICAGITLLLHIPASWLLVHTAGFGFLGAAMATSISYAVNLLLLGICAWQSPSRTRWRGSLWSRAPLKDVGHFIRLGLPSTIIACMESWGIHALIPMAGLLPNAELQLALITILLSTFFFAFTIAFGFGAALSTRVSKEMGAGRPRSAKHAAAVGLPICAVAGAVMAGLLLALRRVVPLAFCHDSQAVEDAAWLMPGLAGMVFLDTLQEGLIGVVRGCGQGGVGAVINLAADVVGIASASYMALGLGWRLLGLLLGMTAGIVGQSVALGVVILTNDWADQSVKVIRRVESRHDGFLDSSTVPLLD